MATRGNITLSVTIDGQVLMLSSSALLIPTLVLTSCVVGSQHVIASPMWILSTYGPVVPANTLGKFRYLPMHTLCDARYSPSIIGSYSLRQRLARGGCEQQHFLVSRLFSALSSAFSILSQLIFLKSTHLFLSSTHLCRKPTILCHVLSSHMLASSYLNGTPGICLGTP